MTPFPDRKIERDHYDRSSLFGGKARDGVWEGQLNPSAPAWLELGCAAGMSPLLVAGRFSRLAGRSGRRFGCATGLAVLKAACASKRRRSSRRWTVRGTGNLSARKQAEAKKLRSAVVAPHPNHEQGQGKNQAHVGASAFANLRRTTPWTKHLYCPPARTALATGHKWGVRQ